MKSFWKKQNRGLLLGAVLLVVLIGFIVFKEVQFGREVPEIQESAKDFVEELLELNLSQEGEKLGERPTEEMRDAKTAALDALIRDYMVIEDLEHASYDLVSASRMRDNYEEMLENPTSSLFRKLEIDIPENRIQVTSGGSDYAQVTLFFEDASVEACGGGVWQMFSGSAVDDSYGIKVEIGAEVEDVIQKLPEGEMTYVSPWFAYTFAGNVTLQMKRVDGEWRVTGASCYLWEMSMREIRETEETGDVK